MQYQHSNAQNPCPICDRTKDGDCHFNDEIVFCHTFIDADAQKDGYVYREATDCGMWGQYFPAAEAVPKAVRPRATKEFFYNNPDGSPLVKVTRKDDGDGRKDFKQSHGNGQRWVYGLTDEVKAKIRLYRIFDSINHDAITNGQPIFIVEGEGVVDALIALGIAATTAIGGAGKWRGYGYPNYIEDLECARVVICPDRDNKGLQHSDTIAKDFPDAQWCYAIPESPLWQRIPDNGGLDMGDWVADLKRDGLSDEQTRDRILAAVEPRRVAESRIVKSDGKPEIILCAGRITEAANGVLDHFAKAEDPRSRIYAQGNSQGYILVRVLKTVTGTEGRYLHVSKGNDVLDPLTPDSLQWEINRAFEVTRMAPKGRPDENGMQAFESKRTDCPATLPKQILAMGRWPQLPILRGLSYTPLLTKTGKVIAQPGYHEGSGYLLQFDPADYSLKTNPTKDDAIASLGILKDLLSEFCFKTDVDRSAALSLLLTAISRKLYALAPLHAVNAHQPGTGKGTLINLACILATGNKEAGAASFTDNEEEMSKKILATLLSGTPIVNIDNVDRRLGGGTIERVLTAEFYKDRILGVSKNAVCSTQVLWTANGNNLTFTTDMTRRTVLIELDAGMESPETRTFSRDIEAYALEHRGELVSAALTVLQAYLNSGSPVPTDVDGNPINPPPLGSFGGWDSVVRRALLWLGEHDPVQSQDTIRASDDSRIALAYLLESWHSEMNRPAFSNSAGHEAREIVQEALKESASANFKNAVLGVCIDKQGQPSPKTLSYYLRRNTGVVVNGYRLVKGQRLAAGFPWKVEKVEPPKKPNQPEISTSSTLSASKNAGTIDIKGMRNDVDENGIYIDKTEPSEREQPIDVDAKSSTLHLHQPQTFVQRRIQEIQGHVDVDDVDIPSRYKIKTEDLPREF